MIGRENYLPREMIRVNSALARRLSEGKTVRNEIYEIVYDYL